MRVTKYSENEANMEFTMTVRMDAHEWKHFDVRAFDVIGFHDKARANVNPRLLQEIIYTHFDLNDTLIARMKDAKQVGRIHRFVNIRRYCYYFIRTYTNLPYEEIGELYGQDHATVMHHYKKVRGWLEVDATVMREVEEIREKIIARINPIHSDGEENI